MLQDRNATLQLYPTVLQCHRGFMRSSVAQHCGTLGKHCVSIVTLLPNVTMLTLNLIYTSL